MQCPSESKRTYVNIGQGYSTDATNLICFNELQAMPMPIDIRRLDEGKGIEATIFEHWAKWHKSCKAKFNKYTRQSATQKALTKYV